MHIYFNTADTHKTDRQTNKVITIPCFARLTRYVIRCHVKNYVITSKVLHHVQNASLEKVHHDVRQYVQKYTMGSNCAESISWCQEVCHDVKKCVMCVMTSKSRHDVHKFVMALKTRHDVNKFVMTSKTC